MFKVIWFYKGGDVPQYDVFPNEKVAQEFADALKEKDTATTIIGPFEDTSVYVDKGGQEWELLRKR